jgi:hypothetical protein
MLHSSETRTNFHQKSQNSSPITILWHWSGFTPSLSTGTFVYHSSKWQWLLLVLWAVLCEILMKLSSRWKKIPALVFVLFFHCFYKNHHKLNALNNTNLFYYCSVDWKYNRVYCAGDYTLLWTLQVKSHFFAFSSF